MKTDVTWGDGPDIIVSLDGKSMLLLEDPCIDTSGFKRGTVKKGQIDFTAKEARSLAQDLLMAAAEVDNLNAVSENSENPKDSIRYPSDL